jgi:hypothetical protein
MQWQFLQCTLGHSVATAAAEALAMGCPLLRQLTVTACFTACFRNVRSGESVMKSVLSGGVSGSGSGAWSHAMDMGRPRSPSSHVTGWSMPACLDCC